MSIETADILRKLAIGQASIIVVLIAWTVFRYAKKVIYQPDKDRALSWHVALIGTSYLILVVFVVFDLYERIDLEPTWRVPVALAAFVFGLAALCFMMAHLSVRRLLD